MPHSYAYAAFTGNLADVERLLEIHGEVAGDGRGRKWKVDVLHRSAIVLLCAAWEAYCEDVVGEVVEHFVDHGSADSLPEPLRKKIAKEFSKDGHTLQMWTLAGDGWKAVLKSRLEGFKIERDRGLNTPKPGQVMELFRDHAGYPDITVHWRWPRTSVAEAKQKLKDFVELRGSIAHRVESVRTMTKTEVKKQVTLIKHLVEETDKAMIKHAVDATGKPLLSEGPSAP